MANPQLNAAQLVLAHELIDRIKSDIDRLSDGNRELVFAFRRKIFKELSYLERGKPMERKRLKRQKWLAQNETCFECKQVVPMSYTVLDRHEAIGGYTDENTDLICTACDTKRQAAKKYA